MTFSQTELPIVRIAGMTLEDSKSVNLSFQNRGCSVIVNTNNLPNGLRELFSQGKGVVNERLEIEEKLMGSDEVERTVTTVGTAQNGSIQYLLDDKQTPALYKISINFTVGE